MLKYWGTFEALMCNTVTLLYTPLLSVQYRVAILIDQLVNIILTLYDAVPHYIEWRF